MAVGDQIVFSYSEIVEALIKQRNLHVGHWQLTIGFGTAGGNIGPSSNELTPTILVPIKNVGLVEISEPTNLSLDAAVVNPAPQEVKKARRSVARASKK